jgi:hypothetical protein
MIVWRIVGFVVASMILSSASAQTLTILHIFVGGKSDGMWPWAGLAQGADGNFYGTTFDGGRSNCQHLTKRIKTSRVRRSPTSWCMVT